MSDQAKVVDALVAACDKVDELEELVEDLSKLELPRAIEDKIRICLNRARLRIEEAREQLYEALHDHGLNACERREMS